MLKMKTPIAITNPNLPMEEFFGDNDLILANIFRNLHGEDLKTCRLVCRKWRDVSQPQFKSEMTIVFERNDTRVNSLRNRLKGFESFFRDFPNDCDGLPLESVKFIKTNCTVRDNMWTDNWLDLFGDGIKNLTVVVDHYRYHLLMHQLKAFQYIIFRYIYNVENLSLIFIVLDDQNIQDDTPDSFVPIWPNKYGKMVGSKLYSLKSLKYFVHEKFTWSYDPTREVARCLFEIISAAENLESLEMNLNPNHTTTLLRIPPENLVSIRELSLVDWKSNYLQVIRAISKLADVGRKGKLKLNSFTLQCTCPHNEQSRVGDILLHSQLLLVFLRSQKNCLKNLNLVHPPLPGSALVAGGKYPFRNILKGQEDFVFPCLANLERFSLCSSYKNVAWISSGYTEWNELFPSLKTLDYRYSVDPLNSTFSQFLKTKIVPSRSVSEITFAVNAFMSDSHYSETEDEDVQAFRLLHMVREHFPNLRLLKVLSKATKRSWKYEAGLKGFLQFTQTSTPSSVGVNNLFVGKGYEYLKRTNKKDCKRVAGQDRVTTGQGETSTSMRQVSTVEYVIVHVVTQRIGHMKMKLIMHVEL